MASRFYWQRKIKSTVPQAKRGSLVDVARETASIPKKPKRFRKLKWALGGVVASGIAGMVLGTRAGLNIANTSPDEIGELRKVKRNQQRLRREIVMSRRARANRYQQEF